ncbi:MAG: glycosyltransferase family 2 protein [Paracoccaceae bacterium]
MTSPRVSVIVPVFNTAPWVAEAIASLQAQTLPDFEVLVIDDGSGDGAGDVAAQTMGADPRFRLIRQAHGGLSRARNRGLDAARGSVIAFLDSDDRFHPEFLQRMAATLHRTGARWAACGIDLLYPGGCIAHSGVHGRNPPNGLIALDDAIEVGRILPSAWNKIYRRDLFRDLRFRPGTLFEDHEVFWTLAQRAGPLAYRDEALVQHRRMRPGQITACEDDGAFAIFDVLERLRGLIASGCVAHASAGFAQLATRLVHERLAVIGDPDRRERFVAAASRWFRHSAVDFDDGGDPWISAALKLSLAGEVPLSAILTPGAHPPTGAGWPQMHVHHWPPPHPLPGRFAMILGPGQTADAMAVQAAIRQLLATGADMMVGAYRQPEGVHDGWTVATQPTRDAALSGSSSVRPFTRFRG